MWNSRCGAARRTLGVLAVLALAPAAAHAAVEVEPNDTIQTANLVSGPDFVDGVRIVAPPDFDYFVFEGLEPGESYRVTLDNTFLGLGIFDAGGAVIDSIAFQGPLELDAVADVDGEVIVGVCGHAPFDDPGGPYQLDCTGTAIGGGEYRLALPEPGTGLLSAVAVTVIAMLRGRRAR